MNADDESVRPIVHIHHFKGMPGRQFDFIGFYSIFDRPHIIDKVTLRPIIITNEEMDTEAVKRLQDKMTSEQVKPRGITRR